MLTLNSVEFKYYPSFLCASITDFIMKLCEEHHLGNMLMSNYTEIDYDPSLLQYCWFYGLHFC